MQLLQAVAMRVRLCVREGDLVARLGGDEFVVLVLEPMQTLGKHRLQVTASIGISSYPKDGTELDVLLRNADAAMYRVKEDGRNNFQFYSGC